MATWQPAWAGRQRGHLRKQDVVVDGRNSVFDRTPVEIPPERPHPLTRPSRWPALVGLAALTMSQVFRWGWHEYPSGRVDDVGLGAQANDGFIAMMLALVLVAIVSSRSASESGFRIVQLLPLGLGLACLTLGFIGYRDAAQDVRWANFYGAGDFDLGMWFGVSGAALVAASGVATTLTSLGNPLHDDAPDPGWRAALSDLAVASLGALIGFAIWPMLLGTVGEGVILLMFLSILLMPALALWLWHRLSR
jgi:hypothetical protein